MGPTWLFPCDRPFLKNKEREKQKLPNLSAHSQDAASVMDVSAHGEDEGAVGIVCTELTDHGRSTDNGKIRLSESSNTAAKNKFSKKRNHSLFLLDDRRLKGAVGSDFRHNGSDVLLRNLNSPVGRAS
jgi:hypothetical protein